MIVQLRKRIEFRMQYKNAFMSFLFIMGMTLFFSVLANAETPNSDHVDQFSQCQHSLKRFNTHLEKCSKTRSAQPYYEALFKQMQEFLSMTSVPTNSSQVAKCENLLKVIQDIVGTHHEGPDLEPMPACPTPSQGKLTNSVLDTGSRRPLRKNIQYVYNEGTQKKIKVSEESEEPKKEGEEEHYLTSKSTRPSTPSKLDPSGVPRELE
jgi:hypothetical protein